MKPHHWSGWPGAYCMDCGREDPMEIAIALDYFDAYENKWQDPELVETRLKTIHAETLWSLQNLEESNPEFDRLMQRLDKLKEDMLNFREEIEALKAASKQSCPAERNPDCPQCKNA